MTVSVLIILICIVLLLIFKDVIRIYILRLLAKVFPGLNVEEPAALSGDEKVVIIVGLCLFAIFVVVCMVSAVINRRLDKRYEKERAEAKKRYDETRRMFKVEFPMLNEEDIEYLSKQTSSFILLPVPVEENYYHHRFSTENPLEWGVYVGSYFLRCDCTVQTFRCVKLLREKGIHIKRDPSCIYEKE